MDISLQFASLYDDQVFVWSDCLLDPAGNKEIFPPTYNVYRRDRGEADGYAGVLVATKANLITHEVQQATAAEAVLVQVQNHSLSDLCTEPHQRQVNTR